MQQSCINVQDTNLVIIVPADALAPNGGWPAAGTVFIFTVNT